MRSLGGARDVWGHRRCGYRQTWQRPAAVGLLGRVPGVGGLEALSVREVRGKTFELDCELATGGQDGDEVLGIALDVSDSAEGEVVIGRGLPEETVRALTRAITEFLEDSGTVLPERAESDD